MYLSVATTHRPATDLGFLLHKHQGVCTRPNCRSARRWCSILRGVGRALRGGARAGRRSGRTGAARSAQGLLDQYVNDRPYAASSFLSVALGRALRTAMAGTSRERPELALAEIPLEAVVTPLPARRRAPGARLFRFPWVGR